MKHDKFQANSAGLRIVDVRTEELRPAVYNPRCCSTEALEKLKESVTRFGFVEPLVANSAPNRKNVLIGGHLRLRAAQELGIATVPVVYVEIPDIEREKEINVRLNKNTGSWDIEKLKAFDVSFLLDVGFDDADLSSIWDDALTTDDDAFDVENEVEKTNTPTSRRGQVWKLGDHRLMCGDSTNPRDVKRLVGDAKAQMVYSDSPYNISYDYQSGIGAAKGKYGGEVDDAKTDDEYREFLRKSISNALASAGKDAHVFFWCDSRYVWLLQTLYREVGIDNKRICLWVKNGAMPTPQVAFGRQFEPCVYGTVGRPYLSPTALNYSEIMNREVGTGNRAIDDILDLLDIWLVRRDPGRSYLHPTAKPPTLHEKALRRCTKPGDVVLDLFGGSGSTLVACQQMKRRCLMMELSPVFCDVIIKRYEELTGDKAKLIP